MPGAGERWGSLCWRRPWLDACWHWNYRHSSRLRRWGTRRRLCHSRLDHRLWKASLGFCWGSRRCQGWLWWNLLARCCFWCGSHLVCRCEGWPWWNLLARCWSCWGSHLVCRWEGWPWWNLLAGWWFCRGSILVCRCKGRLWRNLLAGCCFCWGSGFICRWESWLRWTLLAGCCLCCAI